MGIFKGIFKRKNLKGFTLVELLAVIVILALLVIIAVPSVIKLLNNTKKNAFSVEAENIIKSAKNAYSNRELNNEEKKLCYSLDELSEYVDKDFTDYDGSVYIDPSTDTYKIWLSKDELIINGSNSGEIEIVELTQVQPASTTCEDIVILACTAYKYNVYLNAYGGEFSNHQTVKSYEMLTGATQEIEEPTKEGYTFTNWQIMGTPTSFEAGTLEMGEESIVLIAQWETNELPTYKLYLNAYGGEFSNHQTVKSYEMLTGATQEIEEPTREDYTFDNWQIIGTPTSFQDDTLEMGEESIVLTAEWISNDVPTHKLYINPNGGTWEGFTTTQEYNIEEFTTKIITNPYSFGYAFNGWEGIEQANSFNNNLLRMGETDISLEAQWVPFYSYSGSSVMINDGGENWRIKFFTDGNVRFSKNPGRIEVFLVGGGGGGYRGIKDVTVGGGGGGGETTTSIVTTINGNTDYFIDIGAGGGAAAAGKPSVAFGVRAAGGIGGASGKGGNGGSGGGAAFGGIGGTNGGDGGRGSLGDAGGDGQGHTTREFGESTGTLYSGGGGGAYRDVRNGGAGGGGTGTYYGGGGGAAASGVVNTGGGGGGTVDGATPGSGGSGIVIIRNARD